MRPAVAQVAVKDFRAEVSPVRDESTLREVHVEPALAPDGKTRAYLIWPAEAFEENVVEERREREELRAAPWWE